MQFRTVLLEIPEDLERAFKVIREARPALDFADFRILTQLAKAADGYRLVGREVAGRLVAVMGFRILHDLAHGSHLSVDDLIISEEMSSQEHGGELLRFAEGEARRLGLIGMRLSSGLENDNARCFYESEGWVKGSMVFTKTVANH